MPGRGGTWMVALVVAGSGCFDSDEVSSARAGDTSTASGSSSTLGDPPWASGGSAPLPDTSGNAGDPDETCRTAIACVQRCILDLVLSGLPADPDLGCVVDCTEQLTVDEAYDLLSLSNCLADECEAQGACGGDDTDGGDTGGGGGGALLDPCLDCLLVGLADADAPVCESFQQACR